MKMYYPVSIEREYVIRYDDLFEVGSVKQDI